MYMHCEFSWVYSSLKRTCKQYETIETLCSVLFQCWFWFWFTCWYWNDGIMLVLMNVKFVSGFIFAIFTAIFNTWRLLYCYFVLFSISIQWSLSNPYLRFLPVLLESNLCGSVGVRLTASHFPLLTHPLISHSPFLVRQLIRLLFNLRSILMVCILLLFFYSYIYIIFSISYSHPSSYVSHFRITSMAFLYFLFFYSNYIFTVPSCRFLSRHVIKFEHIIWSFSANTKFTP